MPITKASGQAVAVAAKGDLVVGSATNDAAVLAVGSANQVLTVDSSTTTGLKWAAASAGGKNYSLVNTGGTALTGATTITVSGISNADEIFVIVDGASTGSATNEVSLRMNTDTGSNYYMYGPTLNWSSTYAASQYYVYGSVNSRIFIGSMPNVASGIVHGTVRISGCNSAGQKIFTSMGGGNAQGSSEQVHWFLGGRYNSTSTISSISIVSSGSNFDAGTVYVYTSA